MKGAVLFGFQSDITRKRKAKYILGIKSVYEWKEKYEAKGIKKYEEINRKYYCVNLFYKFITRNDYIDFNKVVEHKFNAANPNPELIFYKTYRKNCEYIDEKDENGNLIIEEFGKVRFDIGEVLMLIKEKWLLKWNWERLILMFVPIKKKKGKRLNATHYFQK